MRITIVGARHQKYSEEGLKSMVEEVMAYAARGGHVVEVEHQFYSLLAELGTDLYGVLIMPQRQAITTDLLLSVGGDGTFIRASKLVAGSSAKILGVNTGSLGFLATVRPSELLGVLEGLAEGSATVEQRTMLDVCLVDAEGKEHATGVALNEVGVLKSDSASMISVHTYVNGEFVATYDSDGLLVATPTGSTAYSLSAGGAIVHPASSAIILTAVAPHMLNMRPVVLPDSAELRLRVASRRGGFLLSCDGKSSTHKVGEEVVVRRSEKRLNVLHPKGESYFNTLRQKLNWGQTPRLQ